MLSLSGPSAVSRTGHINSIGRDEPVALLRALAADLRHTVRDARYLIAVGHLGRVRLGLGIRTHWCDRCGISPSVMVTTVSMVSIVCGNLFHHE